MDVWITLDNQITVDGDSDRISLQVKGSLATVHDTVALRYDETDPEGGITHADVLFFPDRVHIRRTGDDVSSEMTLFRDGRGTCTVRAAGGLVRLDTELTRYTVGETADHTRLFTLHYSLYAGPGAPVEHRMTVTARPI